MEELKQAAKLVSEALFIRFKYMVLSMQSYCPVLADSLGAIHEDYSVDKFLAARNLDKPSPPVRKGIESILTSCIITIMFNVFSTVQGSK